MAKTKKTTKKSAEKVPKNAPEKAKTKAEEKPTPCGRSEAKHLLQKDLIKGRVPKEWTGVQVKQMRPEYAPYSQARFTANLKTLRDSLERDHGRMIQDISFYGHDMARLKEYHEQHPPKTDYPSFHDHAARLLLKIDVDIKKHIELKPKQLRETRPEYMEFPPDVFRKHIYQEVDERLSRKARFAKKATRVPFRETVHTKRYLEQLKSGNDVNTDEVTTMALFPSETTRVEPTNDDVATKKNFDSFSEQYRTARDRALKSKNTTPNRKPWKHQSN